MNLIKPLVLLVVAGVLGATLYIYFGVFNTAADVPHWPVTYQLMEIVRNRSIAVRVKDIQVPSLDDPKQIAEGAEHYDAMCSKCHLSPGVTDSEIRPGLYPQPPNLTQPLQASPAEMFWVIKHGIKMSAMPAWGRTHDDQVIWGMVAFLQRLPGMNSEEYAKLTGSAGKDGEGQGQDHNSRHRADVSAIAADGEHAHIAEDTGHEHPSVADAPLAFDGLKAGAAPDAEAAALAFHEALQKGDRDSVLASLSLEVTISEGGHTQSRTEYAGGHLGEDIAFLKSAQSKPISLASMPMGDTAMVGSENEIRTIVKGQPRVMRSKEMLTLKHVNGSWKIIAIRWQSGPAAVGQ